MNASININVTKKSESLTFDSYGLFIVKLIKHNGIEEYSQLPHELQARISKEKYDLLMDTINRL